MDGWRSNGLSYIVFCMADGEDNCGSWFGWLVVGGVYPVPPPVFDVTEPRGLFSLCLVCLSLFDPKYDCLESQFLSTLSVYF